MILWHQKVRYEQHLVDSHTEAVRQPNISISFVSCTSIVDNSQSNDRRVGFMTNNCHSILNTCQLQTSKIQHT